MVLCVSMRINRHSCLQSRISLGSAAGTPSMETRFLSIIKGSWGRCLHGCKVSFWPPAKSLPGRVVFCLFFFFKKKSVVSFSPPAAVCVAGLAMRLDGQGSWPSPVAPVGPRVPVAGSPSAPGARVGPGSPAPRQVSLGVPAVSPPAPAGSGAPSSIRPTRVAAPMCEVWPGLWGYTGVK